MTLGACDLSACQPKPAEAEGPGEVVAVALTFTRSVRGFTRFVFRLALLLLLPVWSLSARLFDVPLDVVVVASQRQASKYDSRYI